MTSIKKWLFQGPDASPLAGAPSTPNIPGLGPTEIGRNPDAINAARRYSARSGVPYHPLEQYQSVDPDRARRVAEAFQRMQHAPNDPRVRRSYSALMDEVGGQYEEMLSAGIEPYFIRGADPYAASPYLSLLDMAENKRLGVFPTDAGFGTSDFDPSGNPLMEMSPFKISGQPARYNDLFRAVHDFQGHGASGVGFRAMGEENAYQTHAGTVSREALPALATETRGQNSWLNFYPGNEANRTAGIDDTVFADQKTGLLPNWAIYEGVTTVPRAGVDPNKLRGAVDDQGRVQLEHWSSLPGLDVLDPAFFGSKPGSMLRTPEVRRGGIPRTFYGVPSQERPYRREGILGRERYSTSLPASQLYDINEDPLKLRRSSDPNQWETAIRDEGYSGYLADHPNLGRTAQVFDPLPVESGAASRLLSAGAGAMVGGGMMMSPSEAQAAMQGDGLLAGANLLESTARDLWGGAVGLFTGDRDRVEEVTGTRSLPQSEGGRALGNLVGPAVGQGVQAALEMEAPLTGITGNDIIAPVADWWSGLDDETQTRVGGGAVLAGALPGIPGRSTIRGAQRKAFPGIYGDPREIVDNVPVAPENPLMNELWGVTRADLADIADRKGNMGFQLPGTRPNSRGAKSAGPITNPANTRRLTNILEYARDTPMGVGMRGWYVGDPMQDRLRELTGSTEEAARRYDRLNNFSAMASPGSDVMTEINRGSFAHWLDAEGRFEDFMKYGNATSRPDDLKGLMGHPYHTTAHVKPMAKYREHGEIISTAPKVPTYHRSFGTPETGFQTRLPVGDAHWSRGVGLADTRTNKDFRKSASHPEMVSLGPWWADDVAAEAGLEGVPAQATLWGALSQATGVDSPVGSPKLELITDAIGNTARDRGMSPALVRDKYLMGEMPLDGRFRGDQGGFVDSNLLRLLGLGGGAAAAGWIASGGDEDEEKEETALERKFKARKELLDSL